MNVERPHQDPGRVADPTVGVSSAQPDWSTFGFLVAVRELERLAV